jgi:SAM-dependent methyltransferase
VCPHCRRGSFDLRIEVSSHHEVKEGKLLCEYCARGYPVVNYIPRFVGSDAYAKSFSFQWMKFPKVQYGAEAELSFARFNTNLDELTGKKVLDVGCGSGRFLDLFSKHTAETFAFDLSQSVDVAFKYCGLRPNVHVLQASLFDIPFRTAIFDLVFSFGVLHHTPDTKRAFMQLPQFVKPGGKLALFVYSKRSEAGFSGLTIKERLSDQYRNITSGLPHGLLHILSYLAIPLYDLKKLHKLGPLVDTVVETSMHPDWRLRVLETFDWYSPKYQWKHTNDEVARWFTEAGLKVISVSPQPVSLVGLKMA